MSEGEFRANFALHVSELPADVLARRRARCRTVISDLAVRQLGFTPEAVEARDLVMEALGFTDPVDRAAGYCACGAELSISDSVGRGKGRNGACWRCNPHGGTA